MSDNTPSPTAPRTVLAEFIKPLLPASWVIVRHSTNLDAINAVTVQLHQRRITRSPAAPQAQHLIEFAIEITSPHTDRARAEDQLDEAVNDLIHALDRTPGVLWQSADAFLSPNEMNFGWVISITITSEMDF